MSKEEGGGGGGEAPQAQYVGPYRLEKTLGKGQTGQINKLVCVPKLQESLENLDLIKQKCGCIFSGKCVGGFYRERIYI